MSRISLDDALCELQVMFPQYDRSLLEEVIRQQHGKMESTISFLLDLGAEDSSYGQFTNSQSYGVEPSSDTKNEISMIEEEYGINLHKNWKVRLPADLLIFEIPDTIDDEEYARRLQNEFDEQASQQLLMTAMTDPAYYNNSQYHMNQNAYRQQPQQSQKPAKETFGEKSRRWKNKFMNFLYERKGYKRVSTAEGPNNDTEMSEM